MKKLVMALFVACIATMVNAAAVGWSLGGCSSYIGDAYMFFIIGQNGATDIAAVTAALDKGQSVDSMAYGSGNISATGQANTWYTSSGKTLGTGTYTAFFVVFDSATPVVGESKYAVVSGATSLTRTIGVNTANTTFAGGNGGTALAAAEWKSFGTTTPDPGPSSGPEPTSGLLMVLGGALLALRRKQK